MSEQQVQALIVRALKTFLQAAVSVVALNIGNVTNLNAGKTLAIAAVAAGVSAVINIFVKPVEAK
jgi:hypothetical protein